jgi:HD-GYP domain-containing protein (c-di-GMP phosphodiesterase class II)
MRILHAAANALGACTLAWVPRQPEHEVVLAGEQPSAPDCRHLAHSLEQRPEAGGVVLDNPAGVNSMMAVRFRHPETPGWLIALDKGGPQSRPFCRCDAAQLAPFLALLGFRLQAARRSQPVPEPIVALVRSLTAAIDAKDPCTCGHSERVARVAVELGRELGLEREGLHDIYLAGLMHDIGKIGIHDAVLSKAGRLTEAELGHVRQHVTIGYQILSDVKAVSHLLPGVLYHHERWDGRGYPQGLKGEAIPLLARILSVADSYDAMTSDWPYRCGMGRCEVEEVLRGGAGEQWDGRVIDAFLRCRQKVYAIR